MTPRHGCPAGKAGTTNLQIFCLQNFFALIGTTGETGTMGKFGGLALGAGRSIGRGKEIMCPPHILAGLGCFLLRYCHGNFSFTFLP
jgi:hypothetical protein